jgi:hypothetical protein
MRRILRETPKTNHCVRVGFQRGAFFAEFADAGLLEAPAREVTPQHRVAHLPHAVALLTSKASRDPKDLTLLRPAIRNACAAGWRPSHAPNGRPISCSAASCGLQGFRPIALPHLTKAGRVRFS